jgi:hypothetical protein
MDDILLQRLFPPCTGTPCLALLERGSPLGGGEHVRLAWEDLGQQDAVHPIWPLVRLVAIGQCSNVRA